MALIKFAVTVAALAFVLSVSLIVLVLTIAAGLNEKHMRELEEDEESERL